MSRRDWFLCLVLLLVTMGIYWQVGAHDFVNYDDSLYVTRNHHVQAGLTWSGVVWAFSTGHASNWHPVTWLSHMLDVEFFGVSPGAHHIISVLFHAFNTVLLFIVLRKMTHRFWPCAVVSALFALHPMHVESVAWIAERKDVLSTFFGFLSLWAYSRFVYDKGLLNFCVVFLFFALSLMSKPMFVTLPFVLLLLDYWPFKRFKGVEEGGNFYTLISLFREKIPLFVLTVLSSVITFWVQQHGPAMQSLAQIPLSERMANAVVAYGTYIAKAFWPSRLAVYYPHTVGTLSPWTVVGSLFLLVVVSVVVFIKRKRLPYLLVGWCWFLGTLVPVIGIVQVGGQAMADRYTYLPYVGLFIAVVWAVKDMVERRPLWKKITVVGTSVVLLLISIATWTQIGYWKDSITLFEHALAVTTRNQLAHNQLGFALNKAEKYDEAIIHLREALRITPQYVGAHINLGNALKATGAFEDAASQYEAALRYDPTHVTAMNNLGVLLAMKGKRAEGSALFFRALKIDPENVRAHNNLGIVFAQQGRRDEAIKHFSEALRLDPHSVSARKNLERVKGQHGP